MSELTGLESMTFERLMTSTAVGFAHSGHGVGSWRDATGRMVSKTVLQSLHRYSYRGMWMSSKNAEPYKFQSTRVPALNAQHLQQCDMPSQARPRSGAPFHCARPGSIARRITSDCHLGCTSPAGNGNCRGVFQLSHATEYLLMFDRHFLQFRGCSLELPAVQRKGVTEPRLLPHSFLDDRLAIDHDTDRGSLAVEEMHLLPNLAVCIPEKCWTLNGSYHAPDSVLSGECGVRHLGRIPKLCPGTRHGHTPCFPGRYTMECTL